MSNAPDDEAFLLSPLLARLRILYTESHRHYHTVAHVEALLAHLRRYAHLVQDLKAVAAAIWFHDAIYDTHRDDNEERSAMLAQEELESAGWAPLLVKQVAHMVRATRHHRADAADTDTLLFLDFDLSILGSSPESYSAYCAAIRAEFSWVNDEAYAEGRSRALQTFLQRDKIYRTSLLWDAWEASARVNMLRELAALA